MSRKRGSEEDISQGERFRALSQEHQLVLESNGYKVEAQMHLDNHLVRNSPWKTYWKADHARHGRVFAKINYGYTVEINRRMGEKEGHLPKYLCERFRQEKAIRFPRVLEMWEAEAGFVVVFTWETMEVQSGFGMLLQPRWAEHVKRFLQVWESIGPPNWWVDDYVLHDFAFHQTHGNGGGGVSPFGFDLDENLAITADAKIVVYDFEFLQWSSLHLQTIYLAQKYMTESRRVLLDVIKRRGSVPEMLGRVKGKVGQDTVHQAYVAHQEKLARNGAGSISRLCLGVLARSLIQSRTSG